MTMASPRPGGRVVIASLTVLTPWRVSEPGRCSLGDLPGRAGKMTGVRGGWLSDRGASAPGRGLTQEVNKFRSSSQSPAAMARPAGVLGLVHVVLLIAGLAISGGGALVEDGTAGIE